MADVNVAEKVARAIDPAIYPHINHLTGDGWAASKRAATAALAVLSDPEVLAGMAGVLAGHVLDEYANTCSCEKWEHFEDDYDERVATCTAHVATALADWLRGQR